MKKSIYTQQQKLLSHLLREMRRGQSMTQQELARQLNKPQSFVAKYEIGERRLDVIELLAILRVLECDPAQFFGHFSSMV